MQDILKEVIENYGFVVGDDLEKLAQNYPNMPLVIKWECSPRSIHAAKDVKRVIQERKEKFKYEHAREVFISSTNLDKLREVLGVAAWQRLIKK